MKKMIFTGLLIYLTVAVVAIADVSKTDIRFNTVQPASSLTNLLRNMVDDINVELDSVKERGTGNVYYVDSGVGSDTYDGTSPTWAKATLDAAIGLCTADNGDVIYVMQGHSETLGSAADGVDIDVAGVTVIGCGDIKNIDTMPYFDYTSDVTGAFAVGADGVKLINLRFHANVTDVNEAIEIEAGSTDCVIAGCIFDVETAGTDEFWECIDTSGGAASDRLKVIGCDIHMQNGIANSAICMKDSDNAYIAGNIITGDYVVANINQVTTASNYIVITENILLNGITGGTGGLNTEPCIEVLATTSGIVANNKLFCNVATPAAAVSGADLFLTGNDYSELEATSGAPMWITSDTEFNPIGYNDVDNLFSSSSVAANAYGSMLERMQDLKVDQLGPHVPGSAMVKKVYYVDSNIDASGAGTTPATAFKTIAEAIAVCTANTDDWIYVYDFSGTGTTITINVPYVHLIGNNFNCSMPYPRIKPATAVPGIEIQASADRVEIANLVIGGGSQAVACILFDTDSAAGAYGVHIHDCVIGRDADAPGNDGIEIQSGGAAPYLLVENCTFYGVQASGLDQSGIEIAGNATGGVIRNNYFHDIGSSTNPAIKLSGGCTGVRVENNRIQGYDDTGAGWGISLGASCAGCWIAGNWAASSDTDSDTEPYLDGAADEANAWAVNYDGDTIVTPAD